ncbi:ABC transporter ATP-binding protein [Lacibacter sp. H375]|uniref:ABC transporter ATP-binding protein n=1 Tax=Lacibacter sp. H375 TaxID=3133424 RepID=UPI0030C53502
MSNTIIKVEDLSKQYRLGQVSTGTISHDVNRWWHKVRGKEDPYLKIGETNDRTSTGSTDYVWALKDINFDVKQGEVLGIIGRNGAGKSTLLKILSRTTAPTTGSIKIKGRVASLLEVGTGFHPELSGRDNIFLNGAILGMTKKEITRKFDEIVAFAGVERYIDTPVKRYSSGMYVRLAFAVAAHLEPEILIVDEVLAVGDAEFQKKCLGKMKDVSEKDGRTVLFVSHNMAAINNLCKNVTVLANGMVQFTGNVHDGISNYMNQVGENKEWEEQKMIVDELNDNDTLELIDLKIFQNRDQTNFEFVTDKSVQVMFKYKVKKRSYGLRIGFDLFLKDLDIMMFRSFHDENEASLEEIQEGTYETTFLIPAHLLKSGTYILKPAIGVHNVKWIFYDSVSVQFNLNHVGGINQNYADDRPGIIMPYIESQTLKVD